MTNCEFWKEKLREIAKNGSTIAIIDGAPEKREKVDCRCCDRGIFCEEDDIVEWLCAERVTGPSRID